jgi:hypothetical protein
MKIKNKFNYCTVKKGLVQMSYEQSRQLSIFQL